MASLPGVARMELSQSTDGGITHVLELVNRLFDTAPGLEGHGRFGLTSSLRYDGDAGAACAALRVQRMYLSPRAERLLKDIEQSHLALIDWSKADDTARHGFRSIYEAFVAGMAELNEDQLIQAPTAEEWSMAEVAEHVAEHDRKYIELDRHGVGHYVEHGLEHALQLWRLRATLLGQPAGPED